MRLASPALLLVVCMSTASAQTDKSPSLLLQYAVLAGSANAITASRVPVLRSSGETVYKNILIQFEIDSDGNLRLTPDFPQVSDAPILELSTFKPGRYIGPGSIFDGNTPAFVDGPGAADGGATTWTFSSATGADKCTYPVSATWYAGPLENTPVAARLKRAGITSTAWSYGVANGPGYSSSCTNPRLIFGNHKWEAGTLIGVSQSGNAITIASFTEQGQDSNAPVAQITYRLVQ